MSVVRINSAGSYAAVLLRGGMMEGSPVDAPILVERFSFGWQALDLLNFRCRLEDHDLTAKQRATLMAGMPVLQTESVCGGTRDTGPAADIETLRALSQEALVPSVIVAGEFAMVSWYGGGGGEHLYRRHGPTWIRIAGGGGAIRGSELGAAGVPRSSWCIFAPWDGTSCPSK